jgi:DNA-binding Lrp family transcriptional regulator
MVESQLDKTDLKILQNLHDQGRITNQDLANLIHLSPSSCLQRVRRLEKVGVIASYSANLELGSIARQIMCIATVSLRNHTQKEFEQYEELIATIPEVVECFTVSGESDFFVRVICPDMKRYLEINGELLSANSSRVNINTFVVMKENKRFHGVNLKTLVEG